MVKGGGHNIDVSDGNNMENRISHGGDRGVFTSGLHLHYCIDAFQGVSIYVALVLFAKSVRDELIKWNVKKNEKLMKPNLSVVMNTCITKCI